MSNVVECPRNLPFVENEDELWIALQVCDSSFPGGSFAHSLGLESALHHKFVDDASGSLDLFVSQTLEQANTQLIPLVIAAHNRYSDPNSVGKHSSSLEMLLTVDRLCHISLTNEVSRRASINQGKCFVRAAREAFSSRSLGMTSLADEIDRKYDEEKESSKMARCNDSVVSMSSHKYDGCEKFHCHYAPVFGAICGVLNITESLTQRMFFKCILRDIFSSAARLNIMGPLEGARKQREFSFVVEKLLKMPYNDEFEYENSKQISAQAKGNFSPMDGINSIDQNRMHKRSFVELEPVTTSPMLEILQARHDVLYARLFNS